jgi:ABC-type branched-subunit amino acid transport system ATPase component
VTLALHGIGVRLGPVMALQDVDLGRVIARGTTAEIRADPAVTTAYLGA